MPPGHWGDKYHLSFDISGQIGALAFDDEDLMGVNQDGTGWFMSANLDGLYFNLGEGVDVEAYHFVVVESDIFSDGFESGTTAAWSQTVN